MTPSVDRQRICRNGELGRGEIDQHAADFGAGQAQRRAAVLDRLAAGGLPFVGRIGGIRRIDLHARQRQVEFLGRDLPERGQDALPQLDLAGVDGGVAVAADADPGVEQAVVVEAAGQPRGGALGQQFGRIERKGEHEAAHSLGEAAAREGRSVHGQVLPICLPARTTAATMRLCVPQRQRWPASASRTSASVGCGLWSSSSFAFMIMPLMQ